MTTSPEQLEIILAQPRGSCAGVERAIDIVEKALEIYGPPIYVRHEIVHNKFVLDNLTSKGVIFVNEVDEIPEGAVTIFSAHGVSEKVIEDADRRQLDWIDATCPLVTKVHLEARRHEKAGRELILIGHRGHPEVEGTSGRVKGHVHLVSNESDVDTLNVENPDQLAYVTQTTLSVDDTRHIIEKLKARYPNIVGPDLKDICFATQNRQNAVKDLSKEVDLLLVIGATNSSNSNRLRDLGETMGVTSYLIDNEKAIQKSWLNNISKIGITAGASAPELLVQNVVNFLKTCAPTTTVRTLDGVEETIQFKLPKKLTDKIDEDMHESA